MVQLRIKLKADDRHCIVVLQSHSCSRFMLKKKEKSYVSELKQVCLSRTVTLEAQTNFDIHFPGMSITLTRKDPLGLCHPWEMNANVGLGACRIISVASETSKAALAMLELYFGEINKCGKRGLSEDLPHCSAKIAAKARVNEIFGLG